MGERQLIGRSTTNWLVRGGIALSIMVATEATAVGAEEASGPEFVEVAAQAGIDFQHVTGASGRKFFPETFAGGVAFLDYDGDGFLDVYMVNGAPLPGYQTSSDAGNVLYRNRGDGTFERVDGAAGADDRGYGMGCAAADYDNDGRLDLYVTNYGANVLYRNIGIGGNGGSGRFVDATERAAVGDTNWSTGSVFLDYDNDGDLDLYLVNYVHYDLTFADRELKPYMAGAASVKDLKAYPHPSNFKGAADVLYRNEGDGRFVDVTSRTGLVDTVETEGRGLGAVASDLDGDGLVDIYVANDAVRNFLYHNAGDGSFRELGGLAGVAYGRDGQREAGMGVDAGDYDNDGDMDVVVTNFQNEPDGLYQNQGELLFSNASFTSGVGLASLRPLAFGIGFVDYDNDGYQDLFSVNGHVQDNAEAVDPYTSYAQQDLLLRNDGPDGQGRYRYRDVSRLAGPGLQLKRVGRGCAFGDYDNDGDVDILVGNSGQRVSLLRNDGGNAHNWLSISAVDAGSKRHSIGARIAVRAGDLHQVKEVKGSYSYLSQSDLRVSFGLGRRTTADVVEIRWPSGEMERLHGVAANQFLTVVEGRGVDTPEHRPAHGNP